jgi:hypothetical protein
MSVRQLHAQATEELRAFRYGEGKDTMPLKRAQVLIEQFLRRGVPVAA